MVTNMFMGEYSHSIDTKGRLIIPAKLREGLGDTFVITRGLDHCLYAYTTQEWAKFQEKLAALPMTNADSRRLARFFLSGASEVEPDKMGRVTIASAQKAHAGLDKEAVLIGMANRVEIWDKSRWDSTDYSDMDEIAERLEELGFGI